MNGGKMNETLEVINSLCSVHGNFSGKEVSDEDLESILKASVRTANSSARQPYSIVVVRDKETQKSLGYSGSVMLVYNIDLYRQYSLAEYLGFKRPRISYYELLTAATDTAMAMQTACLAATSLGIDSLVTNCVHRGDISRVYRLLNLPERECFPLIALVLGYPVSEPERRKGRLCDQSIIHRGTYKIPDEEELKRISALYDEPDMSLLQPRYRTKGYSRYLGWFFKEWCRYEEKGTSTLRKTDSDTVMEALMKAGFCPEI